ncbi:hypothetical protein, partial [Janibacter anophelis]
ADAAPAASAEAGLLVPALTTDVASTSAGDVKAGTFGTPDGTLTIQAVSTADSVPGTLIGGAEPAYTPASGEEFYVIEYGYVPNEDDQTPATELHVDSNGTKRLVEELDQGEGTFLVSLPSGGEGSQLVVTADGHEQVFDIPTLARVADPLTDVYLRPVIDQDLTDVLSYGPKSVGDGRTYTSDIRMRSARITPYVPPQIGSQGWAEPGSMWFILDSELSYDSNDSGWSKRNATLTWTVGDAEPLVEEGRLWSPSTDDVVVSVPDDTESLTIDVANVGELRALKIGESRVDFGSTSFTVTFADE